MAGKPRTDRDTIREFHLRVRLNEREVSTLEYLRLFANDELARQGKPETATYSTVVQAWLGGSAARKVAARLTRW